MVFIRRLLREACQFRAYLQHLVTEAVTGAQQQHGFTLKFMSIDVLTLGPGVQVRHGNDKRFVIQRSNIETGLWQR